MRTGFKSRWTRIERSNMSCGIQPRDKCIIPEVSKQQVTGKPHFKKCTLGCGKSSSWLGWNWGLESEIKFQEKSQMKFLKASRMRCVRCHLLGIITGESRRALG